MQLLEKDHIIYRQTHIFSVYNNKYKILFNTENIAGSIFILTFLLSCITVSDWRTSKYPDE